jgi:uncharacterized protein YndB with AHSA1/START domain
MSSLAPATSVNRSIIVDAPLERAFEVFTKKFGSFKPVEHNLLAAKIAETVFEPRVGGHIYDRGVDGSECRWARVLAFEPPHRLLLSWNISPRWQIETDPEKASEWEVRFTAVTPERTRVEIEHRNSTADSHRNRGDLAMQWRRGDLPLREQCFAGIRQRHIGSRDGRGAGAAIGLEHVAVQGDRALA